MNITGEIKYFLGEDYALLRFSESKTSFSIDIVNVPSPHRNKGIGTTLINHVLHLADRLGKSVLVTARPIGSSEVEKLQRLVCFYKKFGFEVQDTGLTAVYMIKKTSAS